ncbi:MAG: UbiD family decarboxylase [Dethiobacter sp.]|jgi:4-hydroxy-3-polyprenylbenzoate decarboxylase|nr:MAG: UbiD family decarboxylase [Dethiobacter sp.]
MAYQDLREFMDLLKKKEHLVYIKRELENGFEISALTWELAERLGPAVVFKARGYDMPLVMNVHGTLERNCMALDIEPGKNDKENFLKIRNRIAEALENKNKWLKPVMINNAPCQEVVMVGDEVNLYKLPVFKWSPLDGGPYITMTNIITKDMSNSNNGLNTGMYRVMIHDQKTTGVMCCKTQDIGIHVGLARSKGLKKIPLAIALGVDPVINIVSTTKMASFADDEFELAGGLRGEPVEMVKCKTIDLVVPAYAEIVLEGELDIDPKNARIEGPFAEWMGYYEEPMMLPQFNVTAITTRKDPFYQGCILGHPNNEGEMIRMPAIQANNYNILKRTVVGFREFWAPHKSRGYKVVVQISKRFPGWGKQAALAALSTGQGMAAANYAVVVDDDIDIFDQEAVDWAIATRMDPAKDVIIIPEMGVYPLNPAASGREDINPETGYTEFSYIGKMAIDATKKIASENRRSTGASVLPDEDALAKVKTNWESYGLK